jgi:type I restriction enzyme S subunit
VREGDIIISMSNSQELVGKVARAPCHLRGFAFGAFLSAVRSKEFDSGFLYHLLRSDPIQKALRSTASQTVNIANLSLSGMARIELPLPPASAQRRIVTKLEALFVHSKNARNELRHIPRLIERYKRAVLAAAFRGDLTVAWRETNNVSRKNDWKTETLGNLALDVRYGTAAKCHYEPKATPVLRIPNVAAGKIDIADLKFGVFQSREISKLSVQEGDLLVIRSNGSLDLVGRVAVVDAQVVGFLFAGYLIRLRLDHGRVLPAFAALAFEEPAIRNAVERLAKSTSGVNNINSEQLRSLKFPLPPLAEQHEIVRQIQTALSQIISVASNADRAEAMIDRLDQAILAQAFCGELTTDDPTGQQMPGRREHIAA